VRRITGWPNVIVKCPFSTSHKSEGVHYAGTIPRNAQSTPFRLSDSAAHLLKRPVSSSYQITISALAIIYPNGFPHARNERCEDDPSCWRWRWAQSSSMLLIHANTPNSVAHQDHKVTPGGEQNPPQSAGSCSHQGSHNILFETRGCSRPKLRYEFASPSQRTPSRWPSTRSIAQSERVPCCMHSIAWTLGVRYCST
jgi:hypothetical protein